MPEGVCWWPDLSDCLVTSSVSQGRPQTKPADHNCWDDGRGTTRRPRLAEWRCCLEVTLETDWQRSTRYWLCRQLNNMRQSLNATRSSTLSQCNSVCKSHDKPSSRLGTVSKVSTFHFDARTQVDVPQSDGHLSNTLFKSQWRNVDADITRRRQHRLWKLWRQFTQNSLLLWSGDCYVRKLYAY